MRNLERDVIRIGAQFNGRLPSEVLADALEYTEHNESGLALYVLCQQLAEYDVPITKDEFSQLQALSSHMYPDALPLEDLSELVIQ